MTNVGGVEKDYTACALNIKLKQSSVLGKILSEFFLYSFSQVSPSI